MIDIYVFAVVFIAGVGLSSLVSMIVAEDPETRAILALLFLISAISVSSILNMAELVDWQAIEIAQE